MCLSLSLPSSLSLSRSILRQKVTPDVSASPYFVSEAAASFPAAAMSSSSLSSNIPLFFFLYTFTHTHVYMYLQRKKRGNRYKLTSQTRMCTQFYPVHQMNILSGVTWGQLKTVKRNCVCKRKQVARFVSRMIAYIYEEGEDLRSCMHPLLFLCTATDILVVFLFLSFGLKFGACCCWCSGEVDLSRSDTEK